MNNQHKHPILFAGKCKANAEPQINPANLRAPWDSSLRPLASPSDQQVTSVSGHIIPHPVLLLLRSSQAFTANLPPHLCSTLQPPLNTHRVCLPLHYHPLHVQDDTEVLHKSLFPPECHPLHFDARDVVSQAPMPVAWST